MPAENKAIWDRVKKIDPKFCKPIEGRDYKGTSPNTQKILEMATEVFGPCGVGFGWKRLSEDWRDFNGTVLHVVYIEFWYLDPHGHERGTVEAYGQTKAAYTTSKGHYRVDEDAPKKSLTDAITKAMSAVGFCAEIFLGMYDDNKYVATLREEFSDEPPFNSAAAADRIIAAIQKAQTVEELDEINRAELQAVEKIKATSPDDAKRLILAYRDRKAALHPKEKAA